VLRAIRKAAIAIVFSFIAVVSMARPATASPPTAEEKAKAREHYQKGLTHYDIKEFSEALIEFKNAYRIVQDPAFLFNIAQCYRKLGQDVEALDYYRNYVRRFPNAPNRAEVDHRIQEIEREQEAKSLIGVPPPANDTKAVPPNNNAGNKNATVTPITPPPVNGAGNTTAAPPPPLPANNTTTNNTTPSSTAPTIVATPQGNAATSPFYRRWWFWTGVGAVVVGAIVIGAVATRGQVGDCQGISPCRTVGN
jgi:tetratricopeptide (TPR) repeat protein